MTTSAAGDLAGEPRLQFGQIGVQLRPAVGRVGQVALLGVPGHVALQEQHVVAPRGQFAHQAAIGGRVAVAPGRRDGQAQDDDLHRAASSTASSCGGPVGVGVFRQHAPQGGLARSRAPGPGVSDCTCAATSAPSRATSISRPGSKNSSMPPSRP